MFPDAGDAAAKWTAGCRSAQAMYASGVAAGELLAAINEIRGLPVTTDCPASELTGE